MDSINIPMIVYMSFFKKIGKWIAIIFTVAVVAICLFDFSIKFTKPILETLKLTLHLILLFFSVFYDFKRGTISLMLPESMTLTRVLVITITGCEVVSSILDFLREIITMVHEERTRTIGLNKRV